MHEKIIAFNKTQRTVNEKYRAGDVVKVHRKIKEGNKERIQIFEGMIIAVKGKQSSSPMITVRKVSKGGYGVEIIVPIISPNIEKIELVKRAKVRRAKLYYTREKSAKALRFNFTDAKDLKIEEVIKEKEIEEDIKEEKQGDLETEEKVKKEEK